MGAGFHPHINIPGCHSSERSWLPWQGEVKTGPIEQCHAVLLLFTSLRDDALLLLWYVKNRHGQWKWKNHFLSFKISLFRISVFTGLLPSMPAARTRIKYFWSMLGRRPVSFYFCLKHDICGPKRVWCAIGCVLVWPIWQMSWTDACCDGSSVYVVPVSGVVMWCIALQFVFGFFSCEQVVLDVGAGSGESSDATLLGFFSATKSLFLCVTLCHVSSELARLCFGDRYFVNGPLPLIWGATTCLFVCFMDILQLFCSGSCLSHLFELFILRSPCSVLQCSASPLILLVLFHFFALPCRNPFVFRCSSRSSQGLCHRGQFCCCTCQGGDGSALQLGLLAKRPIVGHYSLVLFGVGALAMTALWSEIRVLSLKGSILQHKGIILSAQADLAVSKIPSAPVQLWVECQEPNPHLSAILSDLEILMG